MVHIDPKKTIVETRMRM